MSIIDDLMKKIDAHCEAMGISYTEFGKLALNNPNFVFRLKNGVISPRVVTVERVEKYIADASKKKARK